jgi:hypothetical protein
LSDDERPQLIERAARGDWEAIEDLVSGTMAPAFDAALHLFGDPVEAARQTEEALLGMLVAIRRGSHGAGDPEILAARGLRTSASASKASPFAAGLEPDDMIAIAMRPDDARRADLGAVSAEDRVLAMIAFALDLTPSDLALACDRTPAEVSAAVDRVLGAIPHERPESALRDILDARASRVRVPLEIEERVLDRFEQLISKDRRPS